MQSSIIRLTVCIFIGFLLWPLQPSALNTDAYLVLLVFICLLLSFFLRPYPMGLLVLIALVTLTGLHAIEFKQAMSGFSHTVVWLVVAAFMIAQAIIDSGFGRRIALILIYKLSSSSLGIAYAVCLSELCLAPVIASNTARGGGVLSPIINNTIASLDITPHDDPNRVGQYLLLTASHANLITSAMFLTAMAANPLVAHYAKIYLHVNFDWFTWALGGIVPGLFSLFLLPIVLHWLIKPKAIEFKRAKENAKRALEKCGRLSRKETTVSFVFILLIVLWALTVFHGYATAVVAWLGVLILLLSNSLSWQSFIQNAQAWDTMIWLGGLITIVDSLQHKGVISFYLNMIDMTTLSHIPVLQALLVLVVLYFYSMYACSMLTAHISAFLIGFMALTVTINPPPMLATALFAYFSCLCACLTHYSTGPVVIYFSYHYVTLQRWFVVGFCISLFHMIVWLGIGLPWWYYLGWW